MIEVFVPRSALLAAAVVGALALAGCSGSESNLGSVADQADASINRLSLAVDSADAKNRSSMVELRAVASTTHDELTDAIAQLDSSSGDEDAAAATAELKKALTSQRDLSKILANRTLSSDELEFASAKARVASDAMSANQLTVVDTTALVRSIRRLRKSNASRKSRARTSPPSEPKAQGEAAVKFYVASGNISCSVSTTEAACSVNSEGVTFVVSGNSSGVKESGARYGRADGSFRSYGQSVNVGDFTCTLPSSSGDPQGVVCQNNETGHGFEASRVTSRQRVF